MRRLNQISPSTTFSQTSSRSVPEAETLQSSVPVIQGMLFLEPEISFVLIVKGPDSTDIYVATCSLLPPQFDIPPTEDQVAVLDRYVFGQPLRRDILHLCINYYRDNIRQGTASKKTRGEVAGSGRKIRPQKGTGHARLGDGQSPMLRGGGLAFAPKPRDFSTDLPRKVRQFGMRVALSSKVHVNTLGVAENLDWPGVKTNAFSRRMEELGWGKVLFVTGDHTPRLERVCRNVPGIEAKKAEDLNIYDVLKWPRLVLDLKAVDFFERLLGKDLSEADRIPLQPTPSLRFSRMVAGRIGKHSPRIADADEEIRRKANDSLFEGDKPEVEEIVATNTP